MPDAYTIKSGVVLHNFAKHFVSKVAISFKTSTGKALVVTSGYRSPVEQASAMYTKFQGSEWNIYRDKTTLSEIRAVYLRGLAARKSRSYIIAEMTTVIDSQVRQHRLISKHLSATAVDFRKTGLSRTEVEALEKACKESGAKVIINEGSRPHIHVQF